jgi:nitroimidazol reductase NimA-like FMN-containing flavoprotein (pyridoxamine 5'-phosphate oxidase superfamily)
MDAERANRELDREGCLAVLERNSFGRLAVVSGGQPDVFPVNYALDGDRIIFVSGRGSKLDHASLDRVAFEVDEYDADRGVASSVVAKGTAREFTGALDPTSEREQDLAVPTWISPANTHRVRIVPRDMTGRELHRSPR